MNSVKKSCVSCFKTLAERTRLRILKELQEHGARNVTELTRMLGITQPTVSHHLDVLFKNSIVEKKQEGKHIYYTYNNNYPCRSCGIFSASIRI
ncbi:MAG: hypothetical protein COU90_03345 [Candidatus Ryanbacteria bacterium CG10_big_fil_rev_8_21_14_0_10_43_42]|uniref:HTH arsR-type domain-containing protein n=1 Tax=Candidatus Ryanbacteria bacterium CG10_big_fil_rev_8_21_14_0_10_43_42 TaxID=1974864 RepID=A0A2M8KX10_9BACT|nr:MAG: hypothetical protein COU90_03345 [Candidatus Ryanbacteria bacterium CG10_big_fil_rev_8_21_14_0_10_43_42]